MYSLPEPGFNSELTRLIFEIERLRANVGLSTTPAGIYRELHTLFDLLMSVVSARIEGNHTTVYDALSGASTDQSDTSEDQLREIRNISATAYFIEQQDPARPLTHSLIREIHRLAVENLEREGDKTPGEYRQSDVRISGSAHVPPEWFNVHADMTDLLDFANSELQPQQQMLQIALAHHRFVWIHPFTNGNGRASRLFTYAMLRRTIFSTRGYSALNPTSVFGNDRNLYISALEAADDLSEEGTTAWATFFAQGIRDDLERIVNLQDHTYVEDKLLGPAIHSLLDDGVIDGQTMNALKIVLNKGTVKSGDLTSALGTDPSYRSRVIRGLLDRGLLRQASDGPRFYQLSLSRGPIALRLIHQLNHLGLLPKMLASDSQ